MQSAQRRVPMLGLPQKVFRFLSRDKYLACAAVLSLLLAVVPLLFLTHTSPHLEGVSGSAASLTREEVSALALPVTQSAETTEDIEPSLDTSSAAGTITNTEGEALADIQVSAYSYDTTSAIWQKEQSVLSDEEGNYFFSGLEGSYRLEYQDDKGEYLTQYWRDKDNFDQADAISLDRDTPQVDLDVILARASTLSGRIGNQENQGLGAIEVTLHYWDGGVWRQIATVSSDATGAYCFNALAAGDYTLSFVDEEGSYLPLWWSDASSLAQAEVISLEVGEVVDTCDVTLERAAAITGVVQNVLFAPLRGAEVKLYRADDPLSSINQTRTATDGSYTFRSLRPGDYLIEVIPETPDYLYQAYFERESLLEADSLTLETGQTRAVIFTLERPTVPPVPDADKTVTFATDYALAPPPRQVAHNMPVGTLPNLFWPGFSFMGWFEAPTGGLAVTSDYQVTSDIVLHAHWEERELVTITFRAYGGSVTEPTRELTAGTAIGTLPFASYPGHSFVGWYTQALGSGEHVTPTSVFEENTTLYAFWQKLPALTLTLDSQDGQTPTIREVDSYSPVGFLTTPIRDGYLFDGWYSQAEGGSLVESDFIVTETVTLYAHWTPVPKVTLSFNTGGGSSVSPQTSEQYALLFSLPTPSRRGYTFAGWYSGPLSETKIEFPYVAEADTTLYAHWTLNPPPPPLPPLKPEVAKPEKSSNAKLTAIKVSKSKLNKKFKSTRRSYTLTLSKKVFAVTIRATKSDSKATLYMRTSVKKYKKASRIKVTLKRGKKTSVFIKVKAEKGNTSIYKIVVKRKK
jgi:uncharacterized repeat protein (TIGR02543 family)